MKRMKVPALILVAVGLLGLAAPAQAQQASQWIEHRNEKYGFSLQYSPDIFKLERTTEAGDGHAFVSSDGKARLLVGALQNETGTTPAGYQEQVAQQSYGRFKVTYRPVAKTWFVLSGEGNGEIFYEKVIFSCSGRLINSFALIYAVAQREVFDPLVERMENSFRAGASCEHAGSQPGAKKRPADNKKQAREPIASPRRERAPAPQFKDQGSWVMRGSSTRGFVILQRTTPPYETKIVRGEAF